MTGGGRPINGLRSSVPVNHSKAEAGGFFMAISKDLLDILACPQCKGDIQLNEAGDGLICNACRLMYPIKDDIPVMLIDEAVRI